MREKLRPKLETLKCRGERVSRSLGWDLCRKQRSKSNNEKVTDKVQLLRDKWSLGARDKVNAQVKKEEKNPIVFWIFHRYGV